MEPRTRISRLYSASTRAPASAPAPGPAWKGATFLTYSWTCQQYRPSSVSVGIAREALFSSLGSSPDIAGARAFRSRNSTRPDERAAAGDDLASDGVLGMQSEVDDFSQLVQDLGPLRERGVGFAPVRRPPAQAEDGKHDQGDEQECVAGGRLHRRPSGSAGPTGITGPHVARTARHAAGSLHNKDKMTLFARDVPDLSKRAGNPGVFEAGPPTA